MKTLKIDEKWSVNYDPDNNDAPDSVERYGDHGDQGWKYDNFVTAMFYRNLQLTEMLDQWLPHARAILSNASTRPDPPKPIIGVKKWYINDVEVTEQEYLLKLKEFEG